MVAFAIVMTLLKAIGKFIAWTKLWVPLVWFIVVLVFHDFVFNTEELLWVRQSDMFLLIQLLGFLVSILFMVWAWIRGAIRLAKQEPRWTLLSAISNANSKKASSTQNVDEIDSDKYKYPRTV